MPAPLYLTLKSYLENRKFKVRHSNAFSLLYDIEASVPQGSNMSPNLYNIYTMDISKSNNILLATFAHNTVILINNNYIILASHHHL